ALVAVVASGFAGGPARALVWPDVPERIEKGLASADPAARRTAAHELPSLKASRAAPLVLKALHDPDHDVKLAAPAPPIPARAPPPAPRGAPPGGAPGARRPRAGPPHRGGRGRGVAPRAAGRRGAGRGAGRSRGPGAPRRRRGAGRVRRRARRGPAALGQAR